MYRMICAVALLLLTVAVQPATAFDYLLCARENGDASIDACTRILAAGPSPSALRFRGVAYLSKGDYDHAIADTNDAVRLTPGQIFPGDYYIRGQAYVGKNDFDRAIDNFDQAIMLSPRNFKAYSGRGRAYEGKNDPEHAIADYDRALELNPRLDDARQARERVQALLAKGK